MLQGCCFSTHAARELEKDIHERCRINDELCQKWHVIGDLFGSCLLL